MFIKCTTIYCLVFSFIFAGSAPLAIAQNLPFPASNSKLSTDGFNISKNDLIYMTDTLSSINDFTSPKQNGCEVQGVLPTPASSDYDCLQRLNTARQRARACMDLYLKTKNTKLIATTTECKSFDKKNAADVIAQQALMTESMKKLLALFRTSDPEKVFKNLLPADKDLFYALFDALAEKHETNASLNQIEKQKKDEVALVKKASELNQLQALGLEISEGKNSETLNLGIKASKELNFEKLKDINAPEYTTLENYLGKEAAQNLKNMYVDPPLKKLGGTKSVAIGDMVIIPNFGTSNNSKPQVLSKKEYTETQEKLFRKFAEKNIQCLELSQKANSKTNTVKEFIRGPKDDSLYNQKEACLNEMAKIHHSMSATLGIEKSTTDKVFSMLKLAIEKDIQNYKKNINISALVEMTKQGWKTFTEITIPKDVFGVKDGKVILSGLATKEPVSREKNSKVSAASENADSTLSNSCYALEYGEELISSEIENLTLLSKKDAISTILPFLTDDLKITANYLKNLQMLEEYPTAKDFLTIKNKSSSEIDRINGVFTKINSTNDQASLSNIDKKNEAALKLENAKKEELAKKAQSEKVEADRKAESLRLENAKKEELVKMAQAEKVEADKKADALKLENAKKEELAKKAQSEKIEADKKAEALKIENAKKEELAKKADADKSKTAPPPIPDTTPKPILSSDKPDATEKKVDAPVTTPDLKKTGDTPILTTPDSKTTPVTPEKTGTADKKEEPAKTEPAKDGPSKEESDKLLLEKEQAIKKMEEEDKKKAEEAKKICDEKIKNDVDADKKPRNNIIWNDKNNKCEDLIQLDKDKKACAETAKKESSMVWNEFSHVCEDLEKICAKRIKDGPSENWIWDNAKKTCEIVLTADNLACIEKIKADVNDKKEPLNNIKWNNETKKCEDKVVIEKDKKACDALAASDKTMVWNEKTNVCENSKKLCEEMPKTTESQSVWNETTNVCDVIKLSKKEQCDQKNLGEDGKPVMDEDSGSRVIRFEWNSEESTCIDLKRKKKTDRDEEEEEDDDSSSSINNLPPKNAPARFRPVQIPSRVPYMMPGMP